MTTTELEAPRAARRRRRLVWPWAVLSAAAAALLLPLAVFLLLDLPRAAEIPVTLACAVVGFVVPYLLAPYPALRIRLLSAAVLVSAVWAAWAYRTNAFRWRPDLGDDYLVPWGVANIPEWAVVAQPLLVLACIVVAVVAWIRLARGRLQRTGWWTALLSVSLLVCWLCALSVLNSRAYLA